MPLQRRHELRLAGAAAIAAPTWRIADAEDYPTRPVRIIEGLGGGSTPNLISRLIGQWLSEHLGQPFVVESRTGAGGNIATQAVVSAAPDGYTLLTIVTTNAINVTLYEKLDFDFLHDIVPVAGVFRLPMVLMVNPSLPVATLPELIAYAKANPSKLVYGSAGTGSMTHLGGELFKSLAGTPDIVHIPYKGTGASLTDVMGGQVPMIVANVTGQILTLHRSGNLRMVVVTSAERLAAASDIPTAVESGLPKMIAVNFTGLFAPAKTPKAIVERIAVASRAVMADETIRANLAEQGLEAYRDSTPEATRRFVEEDIARWTPVVRAIGLKFN